jgi:hypothetical protein
MVITMKLAECQYSRAGPGKDDPYEDSPETENWVLGQCGHKGGILEMQVLCVGNSTGEVGSEARLAHQFAEHVLHASAAPPPKEPIRSAYSARKPFPKMLDSWRSPGAGGNRDSFGNGPNRVQRQNGGNGYGDDDNNDQQHLPRSYNSFPGNYNRNRDYGNNHRSSPKHMESWRPRRAGLGYRGERTEPDVEIVAEMYDDSSRQTTPSRPRRAGLGYTGDTTAVEDEPKDDEAEIVDEAESSRQTTPSRPRRAGLGYTGDTTAVEDEPKDDEAEIVDEGSDNEVNLKKEEEPGLWTGEW